MGMRKPTQLRARPGHDPIAGRYDQIALDLGLSDAGVVELKEFG
jgi:hypothetical protein